MQFRNHENKRTCTKTYANYQDYKQYLASDFSHRCAYCNLLDSKITSFFEVDHFVPQAETKKNKDFVFLDTDYNNLVYACRNCNNAKSNIFEGDLTIDPYENKRFYDPVKKDYNEIFERNKYGAISSADSKGKSMIVDLKLYKPIHNLAWICEQLDSLSERLKNASGNEQNQERKKILESAELQALRYYKTCSAIFTANFNNKNFKAEDIHV